MPLIDSEVLPDLLDIPGIGDLTCRVRSQSKTVLNQVPSGVFLDARTSGKGKGGQLLRVKIWRRVLDDDVRSRFSSATLIEEDDSVFLWVKEVPVARARPASGST